MPNKTQDEQRAADLVTVPNVIGKHFLQAREIAQNAGLTLANPDPDGPPISSIAWPKNPTIQSQSPAPGSVSYRNDSVRIWFRKGLDPDMARKLENLPPSTDWDHATPEGPVQSIELSSHSSQEAP